MKTQAAPETGAAPLVMGEAICELDGEQTSTPDRPFNPWREPATPKAYTLVAEAIENPYIALVVTARVGHIPKT